MPVVFKQRLGRRRSAFAMVMDGVGGGGSGRTEGVVVVDVLVTAGRGGGR